KRFFIMSLELLRSPRRNGDAVLRGCGQSGQVGEDILEFLFREEGPERRHGGYRQILVALRERGVGIHEAFEQIRPVRAQGDAVEDGPDVPAAALGPVARGAGGRGTVEEQVLAARGV